MILLIIPAIFVAAVLALVCLAYSYRRDTHFIYWLEQNRPRIQTTPKEWFLNLPDGRHARGPTLAEAIERIRGQ